MISEYLKYLNSIKTLSKEEENKLWQEYCEHDDQKAREKLISSYQPLVFKIVRQYNNDQNLMMDLIQEGTVGLITAVDRFDHTQRSKFSTYAFYHIRGRILDYLKEGAQPELSLQKEINGFKVLELLPDKLQKELSQVVEDKILLKKIGSIISGLPGKEKQVLKSLYLEELSASEAARELQITQSYLYRLKKKAIQRLQGKLASFIQYWK